jgi:hypothetical protein
MLDTLSLWHVAILLFVLLPYIASIWAIVVTARETTIPAIVVVLWALTMLALPYVGLIAWVVWWNARKRSHANQNS